MTKTFLMKYYLKSQSYYLFSEAALHNQKLIV